MRTNLVLHSALPLVVAAATTFVPYAVAQEPLDERVEAVFAEWDKPDSPGCAVAVIRDGKIVYEDGYGMANLEHGVAITPRTVFYAGSVSKQFVAMSIALLAEQGALSFDDDIRRYLPEIPEYDQPITIRHLVHHTSGLRDYLTLSSLAGRDYAGGLLEQEVIDLVARQRELNFQPGERYLYSNSGYFLLAEIVRRASGMSLREFAEEHIFKPLGMNESHFHDDNTHVVPNRADGYSRRDDGSWGAMTMRFALVGSGGLYTTVEDLFRWDQNFYHNRLGTGGQALIDTTLTRGVLNNGNELDYAFAISLGEYRGRPTVSHGGALGGYRAHLVRFPEQRFSVAMLCNLANVNPGSLANQIADAYLADQLAPEAETAAPKAEERAERKVAQVDPAVYDDYVARYVNQTGLVLAVTKEDGRLLLDWPGIPTLELLPESETTFFQQYDEDRFSFQRDGAGRVARLFVHRGGDTTSFMRAPTMTPGQLAEYAGTYFSDELEVAYRLFVKDGELLLQIRSRSPTPVTIVRNDMAAARVGRVAFERDDEGRITGFTLNAGRVRNLRFVRR
ncbi:MAG: serine hydrolase [Gemmatimonadales bacterium]|nr:serine hydrolase [Gemmatimonadales bacterium]NIN10879.1 serine hydrolase [Gemmatimonadales bacterium]NIR02887.1 serine hydrolase [Gemmatimonadales bacterium]NIS66521.1 serine hydrolase [Gemmatimonadales bacterium]